jgi:hypothetical protein
MDISGQYPALHQKVGQNTDLVVNEDKLIFFLGQKMGLTVLID